MWAEINGERKKVACGPCIRGHRSSKCDHRDRVLLEVRKPGRPLSSCPHPSGSCSCERIVINYTIPKASECACPSERSQPVSLVAGNSRVQKSRARKSSTVNTTSLEKAIKASQDTETDTSSLTRTPTETSVSNAPSPSSSTSSTPRLLPTQQKETISSCCKPKPVEQPPVQQESSCCSNNTKEATRPVQTKSCCSGSNVQPNPAPYEQSNGAPPLGNYQQFQPQGAFQNPLFKNFQPNSFPLPSLPFGFGSPIYNHAAHAYQQATPMSMNVPINVQMGQGANHAGNQAPEHNCHCGDSCSCFGCAAHPHNATMMEYLRVMHQYMTTGGFGTFQPPLYDLPAYPHHPGFGAEAGSSMGFNPAAGNFPSPAPAQIGFQPNMNMMSIPTTPMNVSSPWEQTPMQATSAAESQYFDANHNLTLGEPQLSVKTEEPKLSPRLVAESPIEGRDEDTPTLSPSSYLWQELVLPGCDDATGTCQCGEGCECVGCLTHGGHNGVQLDAGPIVGQDSFADFTADNSLNGTGTTNLVFNEGPT